MEFLFFLFVLWIIVSGVRSVAGNKPSAPAVPPPDYFGTRELPAGRVDDGGPVLLAPAVTAGGDITEVVMWRDEAANSHDLDLRQADVVSLEEVAPGMSLEARPVPRRDLSLELEVDRAAEHDRFHRRYVEAEPARAEGPHGLLDDLRDPGGARRAVLMAEILGPPVGLHGSADPADR